MKSLKSFVSIALGILLFGFVSCSKDDGDQDNTFSEKENVFQAKVNGELFKAKFCRTGTGGATFVSGTGVLSDGRVISIFLSTGKRNATGIYVINSDIFGPNHAVVSMIIDSETYDINGVRRNEEDGKFTILEFNERRSRGEFYFTILQPSIPRIEVTEGRFDISRL